MLFWEGSMQKYWFDAQNHYKNVWIDLSHPADCSIIWYKIIVHPDEATDSLVSSGACFHDFVLKSLSEKVVCENIGCKVQTH